MTFSQTLSIEPLLQYQGKICISIYMPAHRGGPQAQQNPIRLRNLIGQVATRLVRADIETQAINDLLAPASDLLEQQEFWQHQSDGLVLFLGEDFFEYYQVPLELDEFVSVSRTFYLKPLLPLVNNSGTYYVLAASQNQVRVFQANHSSIQALELENVPTSLAEALRYDDPEKQLQFHSGKSSSGLPIYHGQGQGDTKINILRFFQAVDRGLQSILENPHRPMFFVGVDYLFPLYQEANSYPTLLENSVHTNPDELSPQVIHQKTWPLAQAHFQQTSQQSKRRYQELVGSDNIANRLTDILNAAHDGQIDTLFVASGHHRWGIYDAESRGFTEKDGADPDSDSLLNLAVVYTLNCGGQVFVMDVEDMPSNTLAAAILRYPMPRKMASRV